jgi:hypothetical protein
MSELIHLHEELPPLTHMPENLRCKLDDLTQANARRRPRAFDFIGAECKLAWQLCNATDDPDAQMCRRLFLRPCAEAVTLSFRNAFEQSGLTYELVFPA